MVINGFVQVVLFLILESARECFKCFARECIALPICAAKLRIWKKLRRGGASSAGGAGGAAIHFVMVEVESYLHSTEVICKICWLLDLLDLFGFLYGTIY